MSDFAHVHATRGSDASRPWYLSATPLATLPWQIRLHWTTAIVESAVVLVALGLPSVDFPLRTIALLLALSAGCNVWIAVTLTHRRSVPHVPAGTMLIVDVAVLTALLDLTGGPFNPFTVVYAVYVAYAAVSLGTLYAAVVGASAVALYGRLFYLHTLEPVHEHHRLTDFPTHLLMVWIALGAVAELIAYFVLQASNALTRREQDLEAMRARAARSERVVSLTTLAAGAAHELSTPLATIALAARELEHAASRSVDSAALTADARLIRDEVSRCQMILDQMSGRAGGTAVDDPELIDLRATIAELVEALPRERAGRVQIEGGVELPRVAAPRAGLRQALLSLLGNAFDASGAIDPVRITLLQTEGSESVRIAVTDRGPGMEPDVLSRAGEPFFTTKEPGRGLGLGLFLARVFAERCGGTLTVQSDDGTTATLELPVRSNHVRHA